MYKLSGLFCLVLMAGCAETPQYSEVAVKRGVAVANLVASVETTPVPSSDDAADDPAIWIHPNEASQSLVFGTDKQNGLMVYNLDGEQIQALPEGRLNNVDIRQSVAFEGELYDIAVASSRTHNSLDVFSIDRQTGNVQFVGRQLLDLTEPYGTCLYKQSSGDLYAFVNDTDGRYQQWHLDSLVPLEMSLVRSFVLPSQPEGCAADDLTNQLFVGEENTGLWRFSALPDADDSRSLIDLTGAGVLVADVEGMDIYRVNTELAYLIVSSQGDYSYAVYQAQGDYAYLGSFRIVDNPDSGIDGAEETDGLTLTSQYLGPKFPKGLLVVQDGFNLNPRTAQDFKYINWLDVAEALNLQSVE